jgi:hypothetical protein
MTLRARRYYARLSPQAIAEKFEEKKAESVGMEKEMFAQQERVETEVKQITESESVFTQHLYIIYAKEIIKKKERHTGEDLKAELKILKDKWEARGLKPEVMEKIRAHYEGT